MFMDVVVHVLDLVDLIIVMEFVEVCVLALVVTDWPLTIYLYIIINNIIINNILINVVGDNVYA